ncbi:MAG: NAD-dependent epimerase/dehydratase family protein [Betaproteobacteria bacterium]|nr:MAG: NAD-dependent epimerase/dehydratase family protein [Betaproteobacteria bacterium]
MNFLITGGAGSVGRDLTALLLEKGHAVRVLDKRAEGESLQGSLEDRPLVERALQGIDTVVHLAWSFSDDPIELLQGDLKAHVVLLDACVAAKVSRLFYASTAVVYGKPVERPITEDSPCLVEDARKPFYAVAKLAAEKLALIYWKTKGLPVTVFRFWWSYGKEIGGRHLRDMIALAQSGQRLSVPGGAGGSFLDHDDLTHALLLAGHEKASIGQIFNLSTAYLEWSEVAGMIVEAAHSPSGIEVVPRGQWQGAQFLADPWELSTGKAQRLFGYHSLFPPATARQRLANAIALYREGLNRKL